MLLMVDVLKLIKSTIDADRTTAASIVLHTILNVLYLRDPINDFDLESVKLRSFLCSAYRKVRTDGLTVSLNQLPLHMLGQEI